MFVTLGGAVTTGGSGYWERVWIGLVALFFCSAIAQARVIEVNPSNYRPLLRQLTGGDTLALLPGRYQRGLPIHHLRGEPNKPITISAADPETPPVFLARRGHHTVGIINSAYVTIRDLVLDGQGLPVDGVRAEGQSDWAHDITIENLLIRGHGHDQQRSGISTKCPAWNWVVRDNIILGAGTGMYFGNSDGSDPFVSGVIEGNFIADTIGYNLQIKHQNRRPRIPNMPTEPTVTIIRHNVFSKERGGSSGPLARPNVLVGHWPLTGPGFDDTYLVYGNFFYQNPDGALFQGEGNIALYNNVLVNRLGNAVRIRPHNDVPRNIDIFSNTVLSATVGISVRSRGEDQKDTHWIFSNAVFAPTPIVGGAQIDNITDNIGAAVEYLTQPMARAGKMDLFPKPNTLEANESARQRRPTFLDAERDFNGRKREWRYRGAYSGAGRNPGWSLALERKPHI